MCFIGSVRFCKKSSYPHINDGANKRIKSIDILYKNQIKPWIIDRDGNIILKVKIRNNREFSNNKRRP